MKAPSVTRGTSQWDDEHLRAAVQKAELPALLVTLAHITGDHVLIDDSLRPPPESSPGAAPQQGGMSVEQQAQARRLCFEALRSFRDSGFKAEVPDEQRLAELMSFFAKDVGDDYLAMLGHELNFPSDTGKPAWRLGELAPGRHFRVAIIGAGESGLAAAYRLGQAGVPFTVFERNPDVGGVWYENTYPGCRLDTPNFDYSFSFAQKADWQQHFSERDAIYDYFRRVSEDLKLGQYIRFSTRVLGAKFDDATLLWTVRYSEEDGAEYTEQFNALISAVGQLNEPSIPDIPGRDRFAGDTWHTARWRHDVELRHKRVAVVGSGATAFQVIPSIADEVDELIVFQRTPPWMYPTPGYHDDIDPELQWLFREVPFYARWFRFFQFWTTVEGRRAFMKVDPDWKRAGSVSELNERMRIALVQYIEEQFAGRPDLLEKVVPRYPPGAKRVLRDDGTWARTLKSDHVYLVSERIEEITERGIRTADGIEHMADVIIWGTGFRASDFLSSLRVEGSGGVDLHDYWNGDARAYLGVSIPGFPNLFCLYGPNTNLNVNGGIIHFSEWAVNYVLEAIRLLVEQGKGAMNLREVPFHVYNEEIDAGNRLMVWGASDVNSWYKNKLGRVSQNWPGTTIDYWLLTRNVDPSAYEFLKVGTPSYDHVVADAS